jgi:hypothetical protein
LSKPQHGVNTAYCCYRVAVAVTTNAKADEYRRRAEDAEQIALTLTDPKGRADWDQIARQWRALARKAEEKGGS